MSSYNILITGANRGLGRGLLELYLARPNTTVIAATRDPNAASSRSLLDLKPGANSHLISSKIDSSRPDDAAAAVQQLQTKHNITHLDLVIANAGLADSFSTVAAAKIADLQRHLEVNVFGVVALFQATISLLEKSAAPKWMSMSSVAGSLNEMVPVTNVAYGMSKAALNFVTAKIHTEHESLTAFSVHPGWIQTDLGNAGAVAAGLPKAPLTLGEVLPKLQKVIDQADRESYGGKFVWSDGQVHPW